MSLALMDGQNKELAGQATYGMSNLRPESTGLPFIVFTSQKDDARRAARIKWSPAPKVMKSAMGSYAISPFGYKAGEKLKSDEEELLAQWIDLNRPVLRKYWDGDILYTEDAVKLLRKI